MDKKLFIFYLIFWISGRLYFLAPTYLETKIYHCFGLHFDFLCLLSYVVHSISYDKIKEKLFFCWMWIYALLSFSVFFIVQVNADHLIKQEEWLVHRYSGISHLNSIAGYIEHIFIPLFVVYVAYEIYRRMSKFDKENSAHLNDENIFLAVSYPKDIVGLLLCLFSRYKGNSVCLYADGFFYTYTKGSGSIIKIHKDELDTSKFFYINTDIFYEERREDLESLVGKKWAINSNCIYNTYEPIVGPLHNYI